MEKKAPATVSDIRVQQNTSELSVLNKIIKNSTVPSLLINERGIIVFTNEKFIKTYGYGKKALIGKSVEFLFEDDEENLLTNQNLNLFKKISDKDYLPTTFYIKKSDDSRTPVEVVKNHIPIDKKHFLILNMFDLNPYKSNKLELERKTELLVIAEEMVMMGHWQWDMISDSATWSPNLYNIFEHPQDTTLNYQTYISYVHPEDRKYVNVMFNRAILDKKFHPFFHRILLKSGEIKTLHLVGRVKTNRFFQPITMIGTCQDVSRQKMAELKLAESENLYRYMYENAHELNICISPDDGMILRCNETICKKLGFLKEEILNKTWFDLFNENQKDLARTLFNRWKSSGTLSNIEMQLTHKNGTVIDCLLNATAVRNKSGEIEYGRTSFVDITPVKIAETKFRILLETAPDGIMLLNRLGRILLVNGQAEKLLEKSKAHLVSQSFFDFFTLKINPEKSNTQNSKLNFEYLRDHQKELELVGRKSDGNTFPTEINVNTMYIEEGEILIVSIRDTTERQKFTELLKYQNRQLVDFCNIISHNLRGPLLNISMLTDYIMESHNKDERIKGLEKLRPVVGHLNEIFNELVESIQVKNDLDLEKEDIEIEKSLNKVLKLYEPQILNLQASITSDFSEARVIHYPTKYLESILSNLISNSLKYSSPERKPSIILETKLDHQNIVLSVKDNGLGIDLKRHGDKLFKIRKVFHKHPEAKGFGLFMTKTQVEAMGGRIWAESEPDKGCTFHILFKHDQL